MEKVDPFAPGHRILGDVRRHLGGGHPGTGLVGSRSPGFRPVQLVHRSWPKALWTPGEYSFVLKGRQLLIELTQAFESGFRDWIPTNASDEVLKRAKPQDLLTRDEALREQAATVRRWSAEGCGPRNYLGGRSTRWDDVIAAALFGVS